VALLDVTQRRLPSGGTSHSDPITTHQTGTEAQRPFDTPEADQPGSTDLRWALAIPENIKGGTPYRIPTFTPTHPPHARNRTRPPQHAPTPALPHSRARPPHALHTPPPREDA
jgi:hypothetical protein